MPKVGIEPTRPRGHRILSFEKTTQGKKPQYVTYLFYCHLQKSAYCTDLSIVAGF